MSGKTLFDMSKKLLNLFNVYRLQGRGTIEILRKGFRLILNGDFEALRLKTADCSEQTPEEDVYDPAAIQAEIASFSLRPKISVIAPVYNVAPRWLEKCIESVLSQSYQNWELCMHDDGSTNLDTLQCLKKWAHTDPRILVSFGDRNLGISAASNAAFEMATGEFVALLDHDDELHPHALFEVVKTVNKHPDTGMIFTDEDKIVEDKQGATKHFEPFFKPGWNQQLLLSYMYVGHLTVYRKSIVDSLGAFRSEFDWSQDYDLALRVTEITNHIQHIPKVLYHWRAVGGSAAAGDKPYARASNMAALRDALKRRGYDAEVSEYLFVNRVKFDIKQPPKVSIVIVSDDQTRLIRSLKSIYQNTTYPNYEIIIVTNPDSLEEARSVLKKNDRVEAVDFDQFHCVSAIYNHSVKDAIGEYLLFMSDRIEAAQPDWLTEMVGVLERKEVAACSPKLYYEDGTIHYAGIMMGLAHWKDLTFQGFNRDTHAYFRLAQYPRNVSVLTGYCLLVRKEAFNQVGGFDPDSTPKNPADIDLSAKLLDHGYELVYMPYAELRIY
ncbi:MAG: glycosyltransferase family 2 protein [Desulfomonilaceae bacterium]